MNNKKAGLVRFLEILPGTLTWTTLILAPVFSYYHPVWISLYIILFDTYWFLKGANVAFHLLYSYGVLKTHNGIDWIDWNNRLSNRTGFTEFLQDQSNNTRNRKYKRLCKEQLEKILKLPIDRNFDWQKIYHLIILPTVKEHISVLQASIGSYADADYPKDKIIFVLATEMRVGKTAQDTSEELTKKFGNKFFKFITTAHPPNLSDEIIGKGSNVSYAAEKAAEFLLEQNISFENVIVSAFDSDTTVTKDYFAHLTYDFLTADKPHQCSYQPMPMFHNNIWDTPAIARVIATASSFWQMVEASRPDRLVTFSSHSMSFKTLYDVGYWRRDIIPEDSHIFWQCFLHFNGDYKTLPLYTTVSMDAVLGKNYWGTLVAQYKQKRRWAWGAIEMSLVFPEFIKNKKIPLWKRLLYAERLVEGHYFWATASIMIAILGWLPLIFGGSNFGGTVLALNLPILTKWIMSIATVFLLFSVYINMVILPPRPPGYSRWKSVSMIVQWVFSPIVSSIFGSMPAIDAQTRLMFGKYMEFWVTPKIRKELINDQVEKLI